MTETISASPKVQKERLSVVYTLQYTNKKYIQELLGFGK